MLLHQRRQLSLVMCIEDHCNQRTSTEGQCALWHEGQWVHCILFLLVGEAFLKYSALNYISGMPSKRKLGTAVKCLQTVATVRVRERKITGVRVSLPVYRLHPNGRTSLEKHTHLYSSYVTCWQLCIICKLYQQIALRHGVNTISRLMHNTANCWPGGRSTPRYMYIQYNAVAHDHCDWVHNTIRRSRWSHHGWVPDACHGWSLLVPENMISPNAH